MLPARPFLAASARTLARSILLALGMDHALIDFLTHVAIGSLTVLLAIVFIATRVPRRSTDLEKPSTTELR